MPAGTDTPAHKHNRRSNHIMRNTLQCLFALAAFACIACAADEPETITTGSGLEYQVLREADGPRPTADDQVVVHYRGTLTDGTQFDSSYDRGEPNTFSVGGVIPGFGEALQLMSVGSQIRVTIPPNLAYGPSTVGDVIGPNSTLVFEIELLEIVDG